MKLELKKITTLTGVWYYIYSGDSLINCYKMKWYAKIMLKRMAKRATKVHTETIETVNI